MIIKRIKIHNFFLIEDCDVEIGDGLHHIIGFNNDDVDSQSNGSGKSSFCEAIFWAMFGSMLRQDLLKNDVIGPKDSFCEVELDLEVNGNEVTIIRWRNKPGEKSNDPQLFVNGEDLTKHKNTDEAIKEVLRFNDKMFLLAGFSHLGSQSFAEMRNTERMKVLKESLELDRFDKFDAWAKKKKTSLTSQIDSASAEVAHLNSQLDLVKLSIDNLNNSKTREIEKYKTRLAALEARGAELTARMEEYKEGQYGEVFKQSREEASRIAQEISAIGQSLGDYEIGLEGLKDLNLLKMKRSKKVQQYDSKLAEIDKKLANLMSDSGDCSYCGCSLIHSSKVNELLSRFTEERLEMVLEAGKAQAELDRVEYQIGEVTAKLDGYQDKLEKMTTLREREVELLKIMDHCKGLYHQYKSDDLAVTSIDEDIDRLNKEDPLDPIDKEIQSWEIRGEGFISALKNAESKVLELNMALADLNKLRDLLKEGKRKRLEDFLEDLMSSVEYYLDKICGTIDIDINTDKDSLSLNFRRGGGEWRPYSTFSAGERAKIAKSISLALNEVFGIGCLIDDEGMQGLDEAGAELVIDFLSAKEDGGTIMFVSHQSSIKARLENVPTIIVTKTKNVVEVSNA